MRFNNHSREIWAITAGGKILYIRSLKETTLVVYSKWGKNSRLLMWKWNGIYRKMSERHSKWAKFSYFSRNDSAGTRNVRRKFDQQIKLWIKFRKNFDSLCSKILFYMCVVPHSLSLDIGLREDINEILIWHVSKKI